MNKSTVHANANVALTKYWGKRDKKLILPQNSSVSITFDNYGTDTTVEFSSQYIRDIFILDNQKFTSGEEYDRVVKQLDYVRKASGVKYKAKVVSKNQVITAGGIASSASGSAALVAAATKAVGLKLTLEELSVFARLGSGSSTRSIMGGFVKWEKGVKDDGTDSIARQIVDEYYWPEFRVIAVIVSDKAKKIKSRAGMSKTVENCPFYNSWLKYSEQDSDYIEQAILNKDFTKLGTITEHNTLKMHALMMTTKPAIIYWQPKTIELMHHIMNWREEGLESYFTMDAGPQVKIFCKQKDVSDIKSRLLNIKNIKDILVFKAGKGIEYSDRHLF